MKPKRTVSRVCKRYCMTSPRHLISLTYYIVFNGLRFCASRKGGTGGGGRVSTLGPGNMAASGLSCRKSLVSTGWAISPLLCKKCEAIFSLCKGQPLTTTASSLDSGCGLSHESAQDGCNGTCVKLEASNSFLWKSLQAYGSPKHTIFQFQVGFEFCR